jgi:hypothetical protein
MPMHSRTRTDDGEARLHWTFERLLVCAAGCGLFVGAATLLGGPQASSAGPVAHGPLPRGAAKGAASSARLGELVGRKYRVLVLASPMGPLYTVCTLDGHLLHANLAADEVYKVVPDLDVQGLDAGDGAGGRGSLMMVTEPGG